LKVNSASSWFIFYEVNKINPLNAELNPICHLLALLGAHHILHIGRIRVNTVWQRWYVKGLHQEP